MNTPSQEVKEDIRNELALARSQFRQVLDSLSERDFQKQSLNPGWTNGEILAHMTFGFIVIDVLLPLARLWGRLPKGSSKWFAALLNLFTGPLTGSMQLVHACKERSSRAGGSGISMSAYISH